MSLFHCVTSLGSVTSSTVSWPSAISASVWLTISAGFEERIDLAGQITPPRLAASVRFVPPNLALLSFSAISVGYRRKRCWHGLRPLCSDQYRPDEKYTGRVEGMGEPKRDPLAPDAS